MRTYKPSILTLGKYLLSHPYACSLHLAMIVMNWYKLHFRFHTEKPQGLVWPHVTSGHCQELGFDEVEEKAKKKKSFSFTCTWSNKTKPK
jgi:hypothetical protein